MAKLGKTSMKKCFKFFVRTFSLESGEVEVHFSVYIPGIQGDRHKNKLKFSFKLLERFHDDGDHRSVFCKAHLAPKST